MKALITDTEIENPDIEFGLLKAAGFAVAQAQARTPEEVIEACAGFDAALVQYAPFTPEVFEVLPDLKIISRYGIGVDSIDLDAARDHGVWVSNVPAYGTDEVPTHALAMLLSLMRHLPFQDRAIRDGVWHFASTGELESLGDSTLGVIGLGRLGQHVAHLAQPMFERIIGYDPTLSNAAWPNFVERLSLDEVVARAHALTLHIPLTEQTRNIVNRELLASTRPGGAYLVNTARRGLVDLDAILDALENGKLKGVGLDVLPSEPPPMDHPILHHHKALISPHAAWYSRASMLDLRTKYTQNITHWVARGEAINAVVRGTR